MAMAPPAVTSCTASNLITGSARMSRTTGFREKLRHPTWKSLTMDSVREEKTLLRCSRDAPWCTTTTSGTSCCGTKSLQIAWSHGLVSITPRRVLRASCTTLGPSRSQCNTKTQKDSRVHCPFGLTTSRNLLNPAIFSLSYPARPHCGRHNPGIRIAWSLIIADDSVQRRP